MEKRKTKIICDHCKGNGYLRESNGSYTEVHQCPTCNSQSEVVAEIYEQILNDISEGATGKEIAEILEGDKKVTLQ